MTCHVCAKRSCLGECIKQLPKMMYYSDEPIMTNQQDQSSEHFVLNTKIDPFAKQALIAYAAACAITHPELSKDIIQRYKLGLLMSWSDRADEHTEAIKNSHPILSKNYKAYDTALSMVSNRKSKYALVDLVSWLLQRIEDKDKQIEASR